MNPVTGIRRFRRLSGSERRLFVEAVPRLLYSVAALKVLGFRRIYERLPRNLDDEGHALPPEQLDQCATAVRRASRALGVGTCLSRSIALWQLLHAKGFSSDFRIGVDKAGGELVAHAWIEHNGRPVGEQVPVSYKVFHELS